MGSTITKATPSSRNGTSPDDPPIVHENGGLSRFTGELDPAAVDVLEAVKPIDAVYPLLSSLVGTNRLDFICRMATIESLIASDRSVFTTADFDTALYWLVPSARKTVLNALRTGNWLSADPETGTVVTPVGRQVYEVLSALYRKIREGEIAPSIATIEYLTRIGADPRRALASLRSLMLQLQDEIEAARTSHSELIIVGAKVKIDDLLKLGDYLNETLDAIRETDSTTRRLVRDISNVHATLLRKGSQLQRDLTEIGQQYIQFSAGVTPERLVRALRTMSLDDLAAATRRALRPAYLPVPLLVSNRLLQAATAYLTQERVQAEQVEWRDPPIESVQEFETQAPAHATQLLRDLQRAAHSGAPVAFKDFLPAPTRAESFLRNSLLSLLNERRSKRGLAGEIASIPLLPFTENDSAAEPIGHPIVAALTPGTLKKREA